MGKTEETSQMEHPPSLWWNQHTHTQHRNTKMKRAEDMEMNSGVVRVSGRESEERGKGLKTRSSSHIGDGESDV